jgi:PAS domain S-box-containing protein
MDTNLSITADQLSAGLSIAIWNFDEDEIIKLIESGLLDPNITAIQVEYNDNGNTVLSIRRENGTLKKSNNRIIPEKDAVIFDSKISYGKENVGKIVMFATPSLVYAELQKEITLFICFIVIATLLIIAGIYCIFYFAVINPLSILEEYAGSFDLKKHNLYRSNKKIFFKEPENLGRSMEKMLSTINSSYERLEESEKKFRETLDFLPQSVFETDIAGKVTFANEAGLKLFGFTKEDSEKGIKLPDLVVKDDLERARINVQALIGGEIKVGGREYRNVKKDGTIFPYMVYSSVIKKDNLVVGIRSIGIDMTEQRKNEAAINELMQLNFKKEKEVEKLKAMALMEGQENERLRISREIHDGIGQMMTAIKISSDSIDLNTVDTKGEQTKLDYTRSLIYDVIAELRQVSSDLSPTFLYDYGLFLSVTQLASKINKIGSTQVHFSSNVQQVRYSSLIEITFYRIIQEAVNNALKYSEAKNINIALIQDAEFLDLTIHDDGKGFNIQTAKQGNGLKNMASRANLIGANYSISSEPDKGVQIGLQMPNMAS